MQIWWDIYWPASSDEVTVGAGTSRSLFRMMIVAEPALRVHALVVFSQYTVRIGRHALTKGPV